MKLSRIGLVLWLVLGVILLVQAADAPQRPIVMKDAAIGVVTFDHEKHIKAGAHCEDCHHPSKPQRTATRAQQACRDCHTKPTLAGMKTGRQAAFHNPMAKAGTCVDCHVKQAAAGKAMPSKCADCHKKA